MGKLTVTGLKDMATLLGNLIPGQVKFLSNLFSPSYIYWLGQIVGNSRLLYSFYQYRQFILPFTGNSNVGAPLYP